jgi:hypothetical protein
VSIGAPIGRRIQRPIGTRIGALAGGGSVPASFATWNPLDKSPNAILANGNDSYIPSSLTFHTTGARSTAPITQKTYFELDATLGGTDDGIGGGITTLDHVWNEAVNVTDIYTIVAYLTNQYLYSNGAAVVPIGYGINPRYARWGVAVDPVTRHVWFRHNVDGIWLSGDPVVGASPVFTVPGTAAIYAVAWGDPTAGSGSSHVDLISNPANFLRTAPSGFNGGL